MAGHAPIRNQHGNVVGMWLENPKDCENEIFLRMAVASYTQDKEKSLELYTCVAARNYQVYPNNVDSNGGVFLMVPGVPPPGMSEEEIESSELHSSTIGSGVGQTEKKSKMSFWQRLFGGTTTEIIDENSLKQWIAIIAENPDGQVSKKIAVKELPIVCSQFFETLNAMGKIEKVARVFNTCASARCQCGATMNGEYLAYLSNLKSSSINIMVSRDPQRIKTIFKGNCPYCGSSSWSISWNGQGK